MRFVNQKTFGLFATIVYSAFAVAALNANFQDQTRVQKSSSQPAEFQRPVSGTVDLSRSRVYTHTFKKGFGHEHAVDGKLKSGKLNMALKQKEATPVSDSQNLGKLVFDMTSFDADGPSARKYIGLPGETDESTKKQVNENLQGSAQLDVKQFLTADFVMTAIAATSKRTDMGVPLVTIDGKFTLHGVIKPIKLSAEMSEVDGYQHVKRGLTIKQTDFASRLSRKRLVR